MQLRLIGDLSLGCECGWLFVSVCWSCAVQPVQGVTNLSSNVSWNWLQLPGHCESINSIDNGWMDGWMDNMHLRKNGITHCDDADSMSHPCLSVARQAQKILPPSASVASVGIHIISSDISSLQCGSKFSTCRSTIPNSNSNLIHSVSVLIF